MKLTRNGQIALSIAFVGSLLFGGVGYAEARATESKYQEQSAQMQLYREELNDAQSQLEEDASYKARYECIQVEKQQLEKQIEELSKWKALGRFTITFYWPGEDHYGKLTSTGVIAQEGKTIAVDPSVIPYGSIIKINGNEYIAEDCGGAIKGNKIDIFSENPKQEKYQIEIYIKEK